MVAQVDMGRASSIQWLKLTKEECLIGKLQGNGVNASDMKEPSDTGYHTIESVD